MPAEKAAKLCWVEADTIRNSARMYATNKPASIAIMQGYKGLREDISPEAAKQVIFWISQGYLEEKLYRDEIDPDQLEKGYAEWIDILEILLKDNKKL
ncbi:MAG: hypothetical protein AAGU27_16545 [Dehalobacterium sp.]